ncbi:MAG TPA: UDP-N-acetylmuramoyl-L-alanyl-D-glutamate--2,6-diaminopimelate ligase [Terrimicrobiaceae bacterium]|nr:UDP-N-acetylmuramoyl-L-alanyl-D-glutamate--2,6-diaminopimelate ligase [Terrimicrobiaceae bacterium]
MSQTLLKLFDATEIIESTADPQTRVESLCYDSRRASPGTLFFALTGARLNGAQFVAQAAEKGAVAIVSDTALPACAPPFIRVPNARAAMADMAAAFYGNPAGKLKVMGVTGTNGKTTTAFLVKHLLDADQRRCGLVGTVKYCIGDTEIDAPRTTPESLDLQELLAGMIDAGNKAVAMEVSSHGLVQHRTRAIEFDAAVFTNLTQDHLDYHGTMENYFEAKTVLFEGLPAQKKKGRAIINMDDRYGHRLIERLKRRVSVVTYGLRVGCDYRATDIRFDATGSEFHLEAKGRSYLVRLPLIGSFNIYNALAALAAASSMGMELRAAVAAIAKAPQVPGRLERVPAKRSFQVFVDYAHTEDALRNVLRTLRELQPARLITVFGCGGDRDRAKRPLMAAASEELSDWSILTSDNPRTEDPTRIISEMRAGLRTNRYEEIPDRTEAIRRAVTLAGTGDIVLIAGKGHENYQEFADRKIPFDDVAVAQRAIEEKRIELEESQPAAESEERGASERAPRKREREV